MSIITDSMVEKAAKAADMSAYVYGEEFRAALEAVVPDIIDACAASLWDTQPEYQRTFWRKQMREEMAIRKSAADEIRSLKSPQ
jgi:hypothetical protein